MPTEKQLKSLIRELESLHSEMLGIIGEHRPLLAQVEPSNQVSAANLLHYRRAAPQRHPRTARTTRGTLGLSSLGRTRIERAEQRRSRDPGAGPHDGLQEKRADPASGGKSECDHLQGRLSARTQHGALLLGATPEQRKRPHHGHHAAPGGGPTTPWFSELLLAGMNCMRINCAHDGRGGVGKR
jgi:pyruvate kinase